MYFKTNFFYIFDVYSIINYGLTIKNLQGDDFIQKYGFKCPLGVNGRNSDNKLYREKIGSNVSFPLDIGMKLTYNWIKSEVDNIETKTKWIYESPDGQEIFKRKPGEVERIKIK